MNRGSALTLVGGLTLAVLLGCSQGSGARSTGSPTPTAAPTTAPAATVAVPTPTLSVPPSPPAASVASVSSAAQAAALVLASNPSFAFIQPSTPALASQGASYEASPSPGGFTVSVTRGYGDCPAGCIHRHMWTYSVTSDGTIQLIGESGDDVPPPDIDPSTEDATATFYLVAGPVCPVERKPPDPSCAPRPVANTQVVLRDPSGNAVESGASDEQGIVTFSVPGGAYFVEPAAAQGLMGQAEPAAFSVPGGQSMTVTHAYDTGIR